MRCAPRSLRLLTAALALFAACSFLTGCASEPKDESTLFERLQGQETKREEEKRKRDQERVRRDAERFADTLPDYRPAPSNGPRMAIRVTWEALARERELFETSQYRRPQGGLAPDMIVTLVNASHPDAERIRYPRSEADRERFARTAVVPDQDMVALVRGLQQSGFDRLAQPTDMQRGQWMADSARGRVTIEEGPQSLTLLSMRGQGQNPATKDIPALYSEAKRAVMLLRNQNASLNVTSVERGAALIPLGR
ncbi:MAG: hypothetical protein H6806_08015 [Planctomycetes bacterium]|nr:hypothetical protein [Planctomycetota bacterium]MCB9824555.1 hypothetical protein [Planctomycetota bacterium]MCB9829690.1 hypothetical protein [Planctomycetota bacterium]MCB9900033.1 hypothetical protein [Planctomycetota bacterium]